MTYGEFATKVGELANGLIASGVSSGEWLALMSRNRVEWALCDCAIWAAAAVTVPIYETSSAEQVEWTLGDSGAIAAFVETPRHDAVVDQVLGRTPTVREVWSIQAGDLAKLAARGRDVPGEQLAAGRCCAARRQRRSSTPPGRPAGRRAASSRTAISLPSTRM